MSTKLAITAMILAVIAIILALIPDAKASPYVCAAAGKASFSADIIRSGNQATAVVAGQQFSFVQDAATATFDNYELTSPPGMARIVFIHMMGANSVNIDIGPNLTSCTIQEAIANLVTTPVYFCSPQ